MNVFNPPGKSLRAFFLPTKIQQCSKLKFSMSLWKIIETKWTTWETPPEAPVIVGQNIRNSENKTHNPFINPPSTIFSQNIRKLQKIKAFPVLIPGCNFLFPGKGDGKLIVGFPNFRMGTGMNIFSVFCSNCICDCVLCVSPSSGMNRQHRHFTVFWNQWMFVCFIVFQWYRVQEQFFCTYLLCNSNGCLHWLQWRSNMPEGFRRAAHPSGGKETSQHLSLQSLRFELHNVESTSLNSSQLSQDVVQFPNPWECIHIQDPDVISEGTIFKQILWLLTFYLHISLSQISANPIS